MGKLLKHLKVIRHHRKFVRKACFKMGIPWQGIVHDLSKYSLAELGIYKYFTGKGSPHQEARNQIGYSPSWIHHFHKNKHHYQYWLEDDEDGTWKPIKIPYKYIIESFCDFIGAGKAYDNTQKKVWTTDEPQAYWDLKCEGKRIMHPDSLYLFKKLLWNMKEIGDEKKFYKWYKETKTYLKQKYEEGAKDY